MNHQKTNSTFKSNKTFNNHCPYKLFLIENNKEMNSYYYKKQEYHALKSYSNNLCCPVKDITKIKKKLKSVTLSNQIFNNYMDKYTFFTQNYSFKSPRNASYPLKKNHQYLSLSSSSYRNDNKNSKINFSNVSENEQKSIKEEPYGFKYGYIKIYTKNVKYRNQEKIKTQFFETFCDNDIYVQKDKNIILFEQLGLNYNIDYINSEAEKKSNYDYLFKCLEDIHKIDDFTDNKSIDYHIKTLIEKKMFNFTIDIFSFCLNFYEINDKNVKQKYYKVFLPFKLLPIYYLLDFEKMKVFLSEIFYYDSEHDCVSLNNSKLSNVIYKYSTFIKTNISNENYLKNITFYKNDIRFPKDYLWVVCGDSNTDNPKNNKIYKLKIVLPKIKFDINDKKTIIVKFLDKHILTKIIKNDFNNWDKLVLYELFTHERFKKIINNFMLNKNKLYINRKIILDHININNIEIKTNCEFYLSEKGAQFSNYYFFVPYTLLIISGEKHKIFQKIELNLNESQNLKKFSKYWGIIDTLLKCMFVNPNTNKVFFKLNLLENISKELIATIKTENILLNTIKSNNDLTIKNSGSDVKTLKSNEALIKYKSKNLEIVVLKCSLKKIIIYPQSCKNRYYQIPLSLQEFFFDKKNIDINYETGNCIARCSSEIINSKEENISIIETKFKEKITQDAETKKLHAMELKRNSALVNSQRLFGFNGLKNNFKSSSIKSRNFKKLKLTKTLRDIESSLENSKCSIKKTFTNKLILGNLKKFNS